MSRNYTGILPLRGLRQPVRTEAIAWMEIINWRLAHRITVTGEQAAQADDALCRDFGCQMELKATPTQRG